MKIAVEGCAHGELDKIYESIQVLEERNNIKIDLLIICGDFQAVRNPADLDSMAVPPKYRKLNTFYKYYSGEKEAPILTVFIGGNHEASNYLSELSYGGWVCPNIYYMGYANVVNVGGLRIAGLSGIYKGHDYLKGHFESPPYDKSTVKSVYHVRNVDVFRLKQIKKPVDICISHDWPRGVYQHGDIEQLFRFKPFFREEMESNKLGSQPAEELLAAIKPTYWFAAHLHCKFSAVVPHDDEHRPCTKFLALDKCLPKRRFLQVLEIGESVESVHLEYDPEWLCVLRNTNHLLNVSRRSSYMPGKGGNERWEFAATDEEIQQIKELLSCDMKIPNNFVKTAPQYVSGKPCSKNDTSKYLNPQTQNFCNTLSLTDPYQAVSSVNSFSVSDFSGTDADFSFSSVPSSNPDEISCSDEEETELSSQNDTCDIPESADFFIDRTGSSPSTNTEKFLKSQFCSTPVIAKPVELELFPEIKTESVLGLSDTAEEKSCSKPVMFKRRNLALYTDDSSETLSEGDTEKKFKR